jgi:hypothetical protein
MNKADCGSTKPRRHFNYRALSAQALRAMQSLKTTEKERAPTEMSRPFAKRVMTIRSALVPNTVNQALFPKLTQRNRLSRNQTNILSTHIACPGG